MDKDRTMADSAHFWDRIANKYAKTPIRDEDGYRDTLARTKTYLGPNDTVLEMGCGTGSTALELAPKVGRMVATDYSAQMIRIARDKLTQSAIPNLAFEQAAVDDPDATPGPFDAILAHNLLHLVEDVPACLRQVHRRLKPGGVFISKSACLADANMLLRLAIPVMKLFGKAPSIAAFRADQLDQMVVDAGFDLVEMRSQPSIAPVRYVVARKV